MIHLQTRFYRALPIDNPGYENPVLDLPVETTALVAMHCWDIGCPGGPPVDVNFCVDMGWPEATAEACRIIYEVILPAMDAARRVGMRVCHVETDWMDHYYPNVQSRRGPYVPPNLHPRHQEMVDRAHGKDYAILSPLVNMKRVEIVEPLGDEALFFYSDQLDAYLKERGIENLIYTGFATDMCVLDAEGGARQMLGRGYRCILMRDGTVGVESPHTFPERLATRYATHRFEWQVGSSTTFADFMRALDAVRNGPID